LLHSRGESGVQRLEDADAKAVARAGGDKRVRDRVAEYGGSNVRAVACEDVDAGVYQAADLDRPDVGHDRRGGRRGDLDALVALRIASSTGCDDRTVDVDRERRGVGSVAADGNGAV